MMGKYNKIVESLRKLGNEAKSECQKLISSNNCYTALYFLV